MPQIITATEAKNQFSELVNRVVYNNEEFIVQKQGKPAVMITSVVDSQAQKPRKMTGTELLLKLAKYNYRGGPKDLAKNHDKYTWE